MGKRGIVIANTGSPSAPTPEAVREYLSEFLTDPRIRPMHPIFWNTILKAFILPKRSVASAKKYQDIWTEAGSPLAFYMESLAEKMQLALKQDGQDAIVRHAMTYGTPSIRNVFAELQQTGCDDLIVISMYPQSAYSTMKVVKDHTESALWDLDWKPNLQFIDSYSDNEEYRSEIAQSILDAGFDPSRDFLLMAFHSIPMKDISAGDTYAEQVNESANAIAEKTGLAEDSWALGFQCRFDKSRKWLGPTTTEVLQQTHKPAGRLFVVTPNFSIDCLETLHDIEVVLRNSLPAINPELKDIDLVYVPCLNDTNAHVQVMKSMI